MNLPKPVNAYFEADKGEDADALAEAFSIDAVVADEGNRHEGIEAIRAWWLAAKETYHPIAEPLESNETGNSTRVRAKVSGQFPGSPATLVFDFTIDNDQIVSLKIH